VLCLGLLMRLTLNARNRELKRLQSQPMDGEREEEEEEGEGEGEGEREGDSFQITSDPQIIVPQGERVIHAEPPVGPQVPPMTDEVRGSSCLSPQVSSCDADCLSIETRQPSAVHRIGEVDLEMGLLVRAEGVQLDSLGEDSGKDNEKDEESDSSGRGGSMWDSNKSDILSDAGSDRGGRVRAIDWGDLPDHWDNDRSSAVSASSRS
jgi:hypothetical protein